MKPLPASLYFGRVAHERLAPRRHALRCGLFSLLIDIDRRDEDSARLPGFGIDRWAPVSFRASDHGRGDGALRAWAEEKVRPVIGDRPLGRIQLLAAPRIFGMIFNPLSVYFCHDRANRLVAVIFHVSNFHQGRQAYAFAVPEDATGSLHFSCPKTFFVSPFNPVEGEYRFRLSRADDRYRLGIQLFRDGQCVMSAVHVADRRPLTGRNLLLAQLRYPVNSLGVVLAILIEAAKLFTKGLRLYAPRPNTVDIKSRRA